jgi:hypothetical protein
MGVNGTRKCADSYSASAILEFGARSSAYYDQLVQNMHMVLESARDDRCHLQFIAKSKGSLKND